MLNRLSVDEVRRIAETAREAVAARDRLVGGLHNIDLGDQADERGSRNPTDIDTLKVIDQAGGDARYEALKEAIQRLGPDARQELKALYLLGRGDYTADQWRQAMDTAAQTPPSADIDYLSERLNLPEDLMKGLHKLRAL